MGMTSDCCATARDKNKTERLCDLASDVRAMSNDLRVDAEELYRYFNGNEPIGVEAGKPEAPINGFYDDLETKLNAIMRNLEDASKAIRSTK